MQVVKKMFSTVVLGSGDYVAKYLHGTRDVVTATIKIILGNTVQTNVASLHEGGKLVSYSGLLLGFNLFGEMMHDCEKFRNLGPIRYHGKLFLFNKNVSNAFLNFIYVKDQFYVNCKKVCESCLCLYISCNLK